MTRLSKAWLIVGLVFIGMVACSVANAAWSQWPNLTPYVASGEGPFLQCYGSPANSENCLMGWRDSTEPAYACGVPEADGGNEETSCWHWNNLDPEGVWTLADDGFPATPGPGVDPPAPPASSASAPEGGGDPRPLLRAICGLGVLFAGLWGYSMGTRQ